MDYYTLFGGGSAVRPYVWTHANNGQDLPMNARGSLLANFAAFTMYLPANPKVNDTTVLTNGNWSWNSGLFTLARRNAIHHVNGKPRDVVFTSNEPYVTVIYGVADGWVIK